MPSMPDGSDSRSRDNRRAHLLVVCVGCLALVAVLVGGVSLVVHQVIKGPAFPYRVAFSQVGQACDADGDAKVKGLVLDRKTGEVLYCERVPGFGGVPAGSGGKFSGPEAVRVVALAESLASKDGLSEADQRAVERLANEIGQEHGYEPPTLAERMTGAVGPYGLGLGLVLFIALGLWAHYTEAS